MKLSISFKAMLRQPVKMLLFVALIALVVFSFALRAFEGMIVSSEITRLGEQYTSFGGLMPIDERRWDIPDEVREMVEASPLVDYAENLRVIQGVMDGVYTADIDGAS